MKKQLSISLLILLAASFLAWAAANKTPPLAKSGIMPVSEIKPGMKGYGKTVFKGTTIEKFDVEVIDVLKKSMPGQDMILVKISGHNLEFSGVIAGMSGSPIYIDDKIIGALAYAWSFSKEP